MAPGHEVASVVKAIATYLQAEHSGDAGVGRFLDRLDAVGSPVVASPTKPRHAKELADALVQLCAAEDEMLAEIGRSIRDAASGLDWRVDDGQYYAAGAPVGDGYRHGNMHVVLADGDDFAMGLFMLVPGVDYLDHRHKAPEFYLNLTGPSVWRIEFGQWVEMSAGSVVWNGPEQVHATRSGGSPWLSVWAWLSDVDQVCEVVEEPSRS